jgi:hypothetical protein
VFEQNKGSLWKTPSDIYQWLERLLVLIEEAVPWRREVKAIREAVMVAMRWEVERRLREGEQEGEEGAEEKGGLSCGARWGRRPGRSWRCWRAWQ